MHCPRCGHQQASDKIRFCAKCGLAMSEIREILNPELREIKKEKNKRIGKAVGQGLAMMVFGFALVMVLAILRDLNFVPQIFVKIATLVFCIGGVIRMSLPFIFGANTIRGEKEASLQFDASTETLIDGDFSDNLLPEAQYQPPTDFRKKNYDTAKIIPSQSITENTTQSLKEELLPQ